MAQKGSINFVRIPTRSHMAPAAAVRWLLHFAEQDIGGLSDARLAVLAEEALAFMGGHGQESLGLRARQTLSKWQTIIRERLKTYFTESGWSFAVMLSGSVFGPRASVGQMAMVEVPGGTDAEVFAWYALQAILQLGDRFKRCNNADCRAPFVSQGRQVYCSTRCGNRIRVAAFRADQNKDEKRRAAYLASRKKAYAKRARAKVWAR